MEPIENSCPGVCVKSTSKAFPELSTADGFLQETDIDDLPSSTDVWLFEGQPLIVGGIISSVQNLNDKQMRHMRGFQNSFEFYKRYLVIVHSAVFLYIFHRAQAHQQRYRKRIKPSHIR